MMSKKIGDPCPTCSEPLTRVQEMFFYRGHMADGAVCRICNALWPIKDEEIEPLKPTKGELFGTLES